MGQEGVHLILERIRRGNRGAVTFLLQAELVERGSVAAPLWRK
jgi:DNA-binding LacI/PurR family transcriptional regulator